MQEILIQEKNFVSLPNNFNTKNTTIDLVVDNLNLIEEPTPRRTRFQKLKALFQKGSCIPKRKKEKSSLKARKSSCPFSKNSDEICKNKNQETVKPIVLKNLLNNRAYSDTLNQKACPINSCTQNRCAGSILTKVKNNIKTKDTIFQEANEFINGFFEEIKKANSTEYVSRLNEIKFSIESKDTYELTEEELIFGAKLAWRNASKCIGRIQWNKLEVFDARSIKTAQGMFEAICNHLRYSTNNGNIRSAITLFRQRTEKNKDFRIWNKQLISYAGYEQDDKTVIGDKASVEFTKVCQKLGWKGKGTEFDVLPLVLQANGEKPELFELPDDLVLQVDIKHPNFDSFSELNLKWFCVPLISNMSLDIGGLEFTACAFNGWYMGTEIGRDLADVNRYNKLQLIAEKLGLDVRSNKTLWKDKALVELNYSILQSFQNASITITDHHSVSETFMKHMETEKELRGGCPADWVWIVPPLSSHLTPVFHQEMLNYSLKPSYEYQNDAWDGYTWTKEDSCVQTYKRKISLISIIRLVQFSIMMMRKIILKRLKCTILYATETGKSEEYARALSHKFKQMFNVKMNCMSDYDSNNLFQENLLLIVTSTFGNGDPPENGQSFLKFVENKHKEMNVDTESIVHKSKFRYSIFALGNSSYPQFCGFGKHLDSLLLSLKGEKLHNIGFGDELCNQEESFEIWSSEIYKNAICTFNLKYNVTDDKFIKNDDKFSVLIKTLNKLDENSENIGDALSQFHNRNISNLKMKDKISLLKDDVSEQRTLKVSIDVNSDLNDFKVGDHVGICPMNRTEIVEIVLGSIDAESLDAFNSTIKNDKSKEIDKNFYLRFALTYFCDITTPPKQNFLNYLASETHLKEHKDRLLKLSKDVKEYKKWKHENCPHLGEIVHEYFSLKLNASLLITNLPKLKPRYYSFSSSPQLFKDQIDLTVQVVQYIPNTRSKKIHYGVCSKWLDEMSVGGDIYGFLKSSSNFNLPCDKTVPVIMICTGTGIAPFRGFWQEREIEISNLDKPSGINGNIWGEFVLYFGCRDTKHELYREEINTLLKNGIITSYNVAYSRVQNRKKTYIQQKMIKNANKIYDLIVRKNAHLYICGSIRMAVDVTETIVNIFKVEGKMSTEKANQYVMDLKTNSRFHEEIYGNPYK